MQPLRTTELGLQFAAPLSPWWLLLLLPVAIAAGVLLYRGQCRELSRLQAAGLILLRCLLLAGLVFLAFRPSLLWRTILTFPGRIVLLLDDSESMNANDTGLPATEALRWQRLLHGTAGGVPQPAHDLALELAGVDAQLRGFERSTRGADRTADRFWAEAERTSQALTARFEALEKLARTITGLADDERKLLDETLAQLPELRSGLPVFFTGNRAPAAQAYDAYGRKLRDARERFYRLQAALDRRAMVDPKNALHAAAAAIQKQSRLALLAASLDGLDAYAREQLPRQGVLCQRLMSGTTGMLADFRTADLQPVPGPTDLLGPIEKLLQEENPFPLTGIVLCSDGRQLAGGSAAATARLASQKQVPIQVAALGAAPEPWDLGILDVVSPPFAVKGAATNLRVRLKSVLPQPAEVRLDVLSRGQAVAGDSVRLGATPEQSCGLRLTPAESGRFRYTVRAATQPAEIIPASNNSRDLVMNVRDDKVRVLLLDWKPRWETRFLLNILQRLDYIDLNSMIVVTQDDATLVRGVRKGTWPKDRATLAMYDLIVLGDLPPDLLTAEEWAALRESVETGGKTLCLLGGATGARLPDPALQDALWPLALKPAAAPATARAAGAPADSNDRFCITEAGRFHPITAALGQALPVVNEKDVPGLRPDTRVLALAAPGGEPVISTRFVGKGQVLLVGDEQLWKRLNPTLLTAHAAMYVNLVSWAVDGDRLAPAAGIPAPLVDRHELPARDGLHVWLPGATEGTVLEAVVDGQTIASQPVHLSRPGAALAFATFARLPARDVLFRVKGGATSASPVMVREDSPELGYLGRDDAVLNALAEGSGGRSAEYTELRRLLPEFAPKERVEKQERLWRLWDARWVFALLVLMLTIEWIWRKWVGLV